MYKRVSWLILTSMIVATPVAAQRKPAPSSPIIEALAQCRQITEAAARLTCFDLASTDLVTAARSGDVSIVDRAQLRQARRSLFGFSMPRLPFFAGDRSAEDQQDEIQTSVKSSRSIGNGKYRIQIADGDATWETTEGYGAMTAPRAGQKLVIKSGALGSFSLRFAGERWVRARRVG